MPDEVPDLPALRVAITFDDLGVSKASVVPALSERILSALRAEQVPAAVFANCRELAPDVLALWQSAGVTIGNHTATHLSVDVKDAAGQWDFSRWWEDVERCDRELRSALGQSVHYFRFPFLHYGNTVERRELAHQKLASLSYEVAHVSAATSEWLLAKYYEIALTKGDAALRDELASAYVEHMVDSLEAARAMGKAKHGRDLAQITLLHVNALAADHLGQVLSAIRGRGWAFVSLEEALKDPVYSLPDEYAGGCGCSWLARTAPALKRTDDYVFGDYEDQMRARFEARIDALKSQ
jgi:peptidoglycan/xylan/chitin deacetylase (PgdA/CDA1 family)